MNKLEDLIELLGGNTCDCTTQHCYGGHYPVQISEDGDCDWVGCPDCVKEGVHMCDSKPILIGDILHKMKGSYETIAQEITLLDKWEPLGFTKSLQEIGEEVEEYCDCIISESDPDCGCPGEQLTPEAQALKGFLEETFVNKNPKTFT